MGCQIEWIGSYFGLECIGYLLFLFLSLSLGGYLLLDGGLPVLLPLQKWISGNKVLFVRVDLRLECALIELLHLSLCLELRKFLAFLVFEFLILHHMMVTSL